MPRADALRGMSHTQPAVLKTFYSFLLLVPPSPRSPPQPSSGGGSFLRSLGVGAQGGAWQPMRQDRGPFCARKCVAHR